MARTAAGTRVFIDDRRAICCRKPFLAIRDV
jgi:hypothetical protein